MKIESLSNIPFAKIVEAITESFANYFVALPSDEGYWEQRFKSARVNFDLSFGMFAGDTLVGFIINGIDELGQDLVAFNSGTGVLAQNRGHKIIDELYTVAIPKLKAHGVTKCKLEVITKNEVAIHVYKRIGFQISKTLKSFKGKLICDSEEIVVEEINYTSIIDEARTHYHNYAWDNSVSAIKLAEQKLKTYQVGDKTGTKIGYFVINPFNNAVAQMELYPDDNRDWSRLCAGIAKVASEIKVINVDEGRNEIIETLLAAGLENHINQFEMEMSI